MDMSQLDVVVDIEGDVELLLGLGPLLVGGVSCLLETENSSKSKRVLTCKNIFSYTIITVIVLTIIVLDHLLANCLRYFLVKVSNIYLSDPRKEMSKV